MFITKPLYFIFVELQRNVLESMVLNVVGNKTDLESQRQVTREEALQYTASIGGSYFESSALHDEGDTLYAVAIVMQSGRFQHFQLSQTSAVK